MTRSLSLPMFLCAWALLSPGAHASSPQPTPSSSAQPVRLAIAGVSHGHIGRILRLIRENPDVQLVGIHDADPALHAVMASRHGLPPALFHADLAAMLDTTRPDGVAAFGTTADHPTVVEAAAARGIHVMMEKPLAVNIEHALRMEAAAKKGGIHVLINYETTWYPANHEAYSLVHEKHAIGEVRKIVVHDGHQGPPLVSAIPMHLDIM